jgi:hypothetical protein
MDSFDKQLENAYKNKVIGTLEKTVRAVAFVVDAELVRATPVDTGRARSNWIPSLNSPDVRLVDPNQKPDISPVIKSYKLDDTILISNNLPYIKNLNNGSSQQAPAGFVDKALAKGKRAIKT